MDIDAALDELRAISARFKADARVSQDVVLRAFELFDQMDEYLTKGGFLPDAWDVARDH